MFKVAFVTTQIRKTFLLHMVRASIACSGLLIGSTTLEGCGSQQAGPTNSTAQVTEKPTENCKNTLLCIVEGKCSAKQGTCVAASDAECQASEDCKTKGLCVAQMGNCTATDDSCFASMGCLGVGGPQNECAASKGRCIELTTNNEPDPNRRCRYSYGCRHWGKCTFNGQECVLGSERDCRIHELGCRHEGHCGYRDGACIAISENDCKVSSRCSGTGECGLKTDTCVVTAEGCAQSRDCRQMGSCSVGPSSRGANRCVASTNGDCEKSESCQNDGRCVVNQKPVVDTSLGTCIAGSDNQCRASLACKRFGRCDVHENAPEFDEWSRPRPCIAERDSDCVASPICAAFGLCFAQEGECRASETSCRKSEACDKRGDCSLQDGHCVASSEADCRVSADCKAYGRCTLGDKQCGQATPCDEAPRRLIEECKLGGDLNISVNQRAAVGCVGETYCTARCALDLPCSAIDKDGRASPMQECLTLCNATLPSHLQGAL